LFYKVVNQSTIMVIADTAQKRANYEEQVIRTFYCRARRRRPSCRR
jgi:hypothetical protein